MSRCGRELVVNCVLRPFLVIVYVLHLAIRIRRATPLYSCSLLSNVTSAQGKIVANVRYCSSRL
ncbi:uncharacterized protein PHACADRAFT_246724 [Phanerochaete carnosa HHB-10118-sp]|uniref:Uncharacterized protein n=1 Tax=Phanerochaete carnosa (strain HHB-10118-sp) TaxID=650164 RepID=K5W9M9_PHACS|nr:uncharacterized protein PHACADRAFT_246724 [Phanerochaete carnosa HHB-10118-sp]EKM60663.1 hypothetical protein PHACADRAFT_246724 [Phanerochaete carnosa HHB-10118-sp]